VLTERVRQDAGQDTADDNGGIPMELKALVDSLDDVPESDRGYYVEVDGKFRPNIKPAGGWALEDVSGLKSALSAERKARREAAGFLALYGDYDEKALTFDPRVDAGEYDRLKKQVDKLKDAKPDEKAKAEWEARVTQLEEKHTGELGKKDKELDRVNAQIRKLLINSKATEAISKHAPKAVELLMPHVERACRLEQDSEGNYAVRVLDENGNPAITRGEGTGDMTIAEYVDTVLRGKYPDAFPGSGATGSGATGAGTGNVKIDPKLTAEQKLQMYHEGRAK